MEPIEPVVRQTRMTAYLMDPKTTAELRALEARMMENAR